MTASPIRILVAEDNVADAELGLRTLRRAGMHFEHRLVDTEASFVAALQAFAPDVILSDFSMPSFDGMAALAHARALNPGTPFIFVSGTIGEEAAIRALKSGALDYVLKANLLRLPTAVERALQWSRDQSAAEETQRRLARLSRIRNLTSSINSALVRQRERTALAMEVCRISVEVGGFNSTQLGLVDPATHDVVWLASQGREPLPLSELRASARTDSAEGHGITGRSLRTRVPQFWNDVANDAGVRYRATLLACGAVAAASFPLIIEDRAIGAFILHAGESGFFDQDEILLLSELTANIAFALEMLEKQDRIAYLALYDALTGLPNRTLFREHLAQAVERAGAAGQGLALALIDLEHFKGINDTFGQRVGDRILQAVTGRLQESAGAINRVARLGSNLFALIFPAAASADETAHQLEAALAACFGRSFAIDGDEIPVAARAGVALWPDHGVDADILFRNAEATLGHAKETGERWHFYAREINDRIAEQFKLEHQLRRAVDRGELFLHFQPKLDLISREIVGLEALLRWVAQDGRMISPTQFIPMLEQTGLVIEAGRQALASASAMYRKWRAQGLLVPRIAVNVSAIQLRRRSFVDDVRAALGEMDVEGAGVDLEITESLLMSDVDGNIRKLRELRAMGLRIALDDFGTGYSSLAYLARLPVDSLKIDRSFVLSMVHDPVSTTIVATMISLAQTLKLKVCAEGVETEEQAALLRRLHCNQVQGYLFHPPMSAERLQTLLVPAHGSRTP